MDPWTRWLAVRALGVSVLVAALAAGAVVALRTGDGHRVTPALVVGLTTLGLTFCVLMYAWRQQLWPGLADLGTADSCRVLWAVRRGRAISDMHVAPAVLGQAVWTRRSLARLRGKNRWVRWICLAAGSFYALSFASGLNDDVSLATAAPRAALAILYLGLAALLPWAQARAERRADAAAVAATRLTGDRPMRSSDG